MELLTFIGVFFLLVIGSGLPILLVGILIDFFKDIFKVKIGDKEY